MCVGTAVPFITTGPTMEQKTNPLQYRAGCAIVTGTNRIAKADLARGAITDESEDVGTGSMRYMWPHANAVRMAQLLASC